MVVMRHEANVQEETYKLSVVIPCYNEMATLGRCVPSVVSIASDNLALEIIIVDDCSTDDSLSIANALAVRHQEIRVLRHAKNMGKGARRVVPRPETGKAIRNWQRSAIQVIGGYPAVTLK